MVAVELINRINSIFNKLCDEEEFRNWYENDFEEYYLNQSNAWDILNHYLEWNNGSYKWVFFVDDYVVKLPFGRTNDCAKEEEFYHAIPDEFKRSFAEVEYSRYENEDYDIGFDYWIAKAYYTDENNYDEKAFFQYVEEAFECGEITSDQRDEIINDTFPVSDLTDEYWDSYYAEVSDKRARLLFHYLYEADYAEALCDYINKVGLGDLHADNIGFDKNGYPVIIDYSWY